MKSEETGKDMNVPTTNEPTTEIVADLRIYLLVANKEKPTQLISTIARAADRLESQERGIEKLTARAEQAEQDRDLAIKALADYEDAIDPTVEQIMREFHGTEQRGQPQDGEGK